VSTPARLVHQLNATHVLLLIADCDYEFEMSTDAAQKQLSEEVAKFNQLQNDMQKVIRMRQQLEGQLTENTIVKEVRICSCCSRKSCTSCIESQY
jgi:hypothetical protein